jgi:hypothetical protein
MLKNRRNNYGYQYAFYLSAYDFFCPPLKLRARLMLWQALKKA